MEACWLVIISIGCMAAGTTKKLGEIVFRILTQRIWTVKPTFPGSLPSHHLWPRRESAKQIQNWSLHLAMHLNSTNSGDSPLLGTIRGHCIRESSVSWKTHTDPRARDLCERKKPFPPTSSHMPIPLCWRSWFSNSGQGFQTNVALCVSWARAETSWSSGISAWNLKPMLIRL